MVSPRSLANHRTPIARNPSRGDDEAKHLSPPRHHEQAFACGVESLQDHQLLALVLGAGSQNRNVQRISRDLLEQLGSLRALALCSPQQLTQSKGIGPMKAARIAAAMELGRRAHLMRLHEVRPIVADFDAVVQWAQPLLGNLEHEELWMLGLNAGSQIVTSKQIARGGIHGCAITPGDVLRPAIRDGATSIILVHNHPSGDPTPSPEDLAMTRAVAQACITLGIHLLDHVVVARLRACSIQSLAA